MDLSCYSAPFASPNKITRIEMLPKSNPSYGYDTASRLIRAAHAVKQRQVVLHRGMRRRQQRLAPLLRLRQRFRIVRIDRFLTLASNSTAQSYAPEGWSQSMRRRLCTMFPLPRISTPRSRNA